MRTDPFPPRGGGGDNRRGRAKAARAWPDLEYGFGPHGVAARTTRAGRTANAEAGARPILVLASRGPGMTIGRADCREILGCAGPAPGTVSLWRAGRPVE